MKLNAYNIIKKLKKFKKLDHPLMKVQVSQKFLGNSNKSFVVPNISNFVGTFLKFSRTYRQYQLRLSRENIQQIIF